MLIPNRRITQNVKPTRRYTGKASAQYLNKNGGKTHKRFVAIYGAPYCPPSISTHAKAIMPSCPTEGSVNPCRDDLSTVG